MTRCKMFVVALLLFVAAITACTPEPKKNAAEETVVIGNAGNYLLIKGHGFSENSNQNKVTFGNVPAQVLHADANYLLVQVPVQKAGTVRVVVEVGAYASNAMLFAYHTGLVAASF
ncbi:IPT/TIG domain-containing protein [Chitinophaga sp. 30R24]|uniref:IPT/TIG domain-containing protein n=1 Tax=Chitinophaga sp. 30R24 TaxID=3248838 RepID=UPI003B8EEEBD